MTIRFYMHQPDTIFEALINEPDEVTYPIQDIAFDNISTGAFDDIKPGMTVLFGSAAGLDDYGRNRVRKDATSTLLKIGRSSIGTHDGEVQIVNNSYITILDDYRIWSKIPYIVTGAEDLAAMYKDGDLEVGTNTTTPPPVANTGPPAAGTIDSGTGKLAISLPPGGVNESFATASGAAIASYAWVLPTGVAFTFGSVATDGAIQVAADPGFHWIELTVTDDNGKTHTARTFIYARDPASDTTIGATQIIEHRITRHGQTLGVKITQDIPASTYPDGGLVLLMDGEPESQATRRNILFWGWSQTEPAAITASREATLSETTLKCVDVGGRLDTLPGFTQALYNDSKRIVEANENITWAYFVSPDWDNLLHYIIHWHSTAIELTDWQNTGVGSSFPFTVREAGGSSLFDQMNTQCESLCPAHYFTCDRQGMLACPADPMTQEVGDRTATVQANIPVSNWSKIKFTHQRPARTHWLDEEAVVADGDVVNGVWSHAPGDAPGQGEMRSSHGEQICVSQLTLNQVTGHRYARMNAPESLFTISQTQDQDTLVDPAAMEWTTVTITAALAAERGLAFTTARGLIQEMNVRYRNDKEAVTRSITYLWERETVGLPGVYVPPPVIPQADDYEPIPPPDTGEEPIFYGDPGYYIAWWEEGIGRTSNIMDSPPTWEDVTGAITGWIIDCQYVARPNGNETVGLWCLTSAGMWWCADILEATPTWTNTLTLAEIQAIEEAPDDGLAEIRCMANDGGFPGRAILATQPDGSTLSNSTFNHTYFHRTDDYGENWTLCDAADEITHDNDDGTHGHCFTSFYGLEWFREAGGRIYALRATPRRVLIVETVLMYSDDLGETWVKGYTFPIQSNGWGSGVILNPHPSATSSMFAINGSTGVSNRPDVFTSIDNGDNFVEKTPPVGFGGFITRRPNSKHNADTDEHHILALARDNDGTPYNVSIFDSDDGGDTWNEVFDTLQAEHRIAVPNGWPPDTDTWFAIGTVSFEPQVQMTTDYWATGFGEDKSGNLESGVFGDWDENTTRSTVGGIALPKIGLNA